MTNAGYTYILYYNLRALATFICTPLHKYISFASVGRGADFTFEPPRHRSLCTIYTARLRKQNKRNPIAPHPLCLYLYMCTDQSRSRKVKNPSTARELSHPTEFPLTKKKKHHLSSYIHASKSRPVARVVRIANCHYPAGRRVGKRKLNRIYSVCVCVCERVSHLRNVYTRRWKADTRPGGLSGGGGRRE